MKSIAGLGLMLCVAGAASAAQTDRIELPAARFATGDDPSRSRPDFDDGAWKVLSTTANYEPQGFPGYDGWSWYRIHAAIPSALKNTVRWRQRLRVHLACIDDADEAYFNGVKIGWTGRLPGDPQGYDSKWDKPREYFVDLSSGLVRWDADNVIAVRVYDSGGGGGFHRGTPYLDMAEIIDGVRLDAGASTHEIGGARATSRLELANAFPAAVSGTLITEVYDAAAGRSIERRRRTITLPASGSRTILVTTPQRQGVQIRLRFTEPISGKSVAATRVVPYLLTPPESPKPRINGARVVGVRPGSPFLFRVPATGRAPLRFTAAGLPAGLTLDAGSGLITGETRLAGDHAVSLTASNALGSARSTLTIRVGDELALTPPMGWNSWNAYGLGVDAGRIREAGAALVGSGLAAHGWSYVNIDDGWEAAQRSADGSILGNEKFPDMASLGRDLHAMGLKFGIYSSPGPKTCGGFLGSLDHERQDADTYARWGVDYLKYDLCSYAGRISPAGTLEENQRPYIVMGEALRAQPRDIVFSLCQYGIREVWKWGAGVGGNLWRTTGDIEDTWKSALGIINAQDAAAPYARSGHWNDPDMLVVGWVGWGGPMHASRLTPDEQYSHVSMWCLLAAPLLLGNDLARLDAFTRNLLTNDEVIAVDQDPLGRAARRVLDQDGWQVWVRELSQGRKAVGIFNFAEEFRALRLDPGALGLEDGCALRDLWRQKDLGPLKPGFDARVPAHGVLLLGAG